MGESGRGSGGGGVWGAVELRRVGGGLTGKTNKPQARKEMGSSLRDTEKNYLSCARTKKKSERKKKLFDDAESPFLPDRSGERNNICGGNNICRPIMDAYVMGAEREREVEGGGARRSRVEFELD